MTIYPLSPYIWTVRTCLVPGARLLRSKDQCQWSQSSLPVLLHRLTGVNLVLSAGPGWPAVRRLQTTVRAPGDLPGDVRSLLALLPHLVLSGEAEKVVMLPSAVTASELSCGCKPFRPVVRLLGSVSRPAPTQPARGQEIRAKPGGRDCPD